jgi:predicted transcriptional regulator
MDALLKDYLSWTRPVFHYAVDGEGPSPGYEPESGLDPERFYGEGLYVGRPEIEAAIGERVLSTTDPIVATGPCGCGKTSVLGKVLRQLREKGWVTTSLDLFSSDFTALCNQFVEVNGRSNALYAQLKKMLLERILDSLYASGRRWELWRLVLREAPGKALGGLVQYGQLSDARKAAKRLYDRLGTDKPATFSEWLDSDLAPRHAGLCNLIDSTVEPAMRFDVLAAALVEQKRDTRVAILLDNVDHVAPLCQNECFRFVYDLHHEVGTRWRILITLRDENARRPSVYRDRLDASHIICHLKNEEKIVPCMPLRPPDPQLFSDIFLARFECVCDLVRQHGQSNDAVARLVHLQRTMLSRYVGGRMIELTNDNLRDSMAAHRDFLEYLLQYASAKQQDALTLPEEKVESIFYSWLVRRGERNGLPAYSMMDTVRRNRTTPKEPACMLECLALLYVIGREAETRLASETDYAFVPVREVVSALGDLGYEAVEVRQAVHSLYLRSQRKGVMLDFRDMADPPTPDEVLDQLKMFATRAGRAMVLAIANRVYYLAEDYLVCFDPEKTCCHLPDAQAFKIALKAVSLVADMHRAGLQQLSDKLRTKPGWGPNWFKEYTRRFTYDGQLQLQRMAKGHLSFFEEAEAEVPGRFGEILTALNSIAASFDQDVAKITAGGQGRASSYYELVPESLRLP